jgi:hypothetical protein
LSGPGQHCGVNAPQGTALDSWTVLSGTGRFAEASGSGANSVTIDAAGVTVTSVTMFTGTISSPGSLR